MKISMLDLIKKNIAGVVVNKALKNKQTEGISFKDVVRNSYKFLILMPENESHFHHSFLVLNFFDSLKKDFSVFTHDFRVSLLPIKFRRFAINYGINDISRLNLPSHSLKQKMNEMEFSIVLDLNKDENLFNSLIANIVKSEVRMGFKKNDSDIYYNFQFESAEDDPDIFYKNLLNCLQMF